MLTRMAAKRDRREILDARRRRVSCSRSSLSNSQRADGCWSIRGRIVFQTLTASQPLYKIVPATEEAHSLTWLGRSPYDEKTI